MGNSLQDLKDAIYNDLLLLHEIRHIYHNYHQATGDRRYKFVVDMINVIERHYKTLIQMDIWKQNE